MNILRRAALLIFMVIIILFSLAGCNLPTSLSVSPSSQEGNSGGVGAGEGPAKEAEAGKPEPVVKEETITLTALGDILMHNTLIWAGQQPDGSYRFNFFSAVQDLIEQGDYSTTNLETALAGPETGYTGYPLFNSPDAIARHLKDSGVDGVVAANNHLLDRGFSGTQRTVEVLKSAELDTLGTKKSADDHGFLIKDIRGVKVGYLAYTYGTNGIELPREHSYFINILQREQILKDISVLRPQVDVLILVLHWGVEYSTEPAEEQRSLAREFLGAGVDAIIGSHPHVIQPVEVLNIGGKDKFVAYSIGNFIGDQDGDERNSGVMVQLKFLQEKLVYPDGTDTDAVHPPRLTEVLLTPTYSHSYWENGRQQFRVVSVEETIRKIKADEEKILTSQDLPVLENVLRATQERLGMTYRKFNTK